MKSIIRNGLMAVTFSAISMAAVAQDRTPNSPDAPEVLNADSSSFISTPDGAEAEALTDGGFEAGTPNPFWNEASTNFGTPLCTVGLCGTGGGTGPRSGNWWAWFGGIPAAEEGSVTQDVTLPSGSATMSFYLEAPSCAAAADYLEVTVDGNQEFLVDATWANCDSTGYVQQVVDLNAYADGGVHTIEFHSETGIDGTTNFFVDDVSIIVQEEGSARFAVSKLFSDGNTSEVEVTLSCNTGLPLEQTTTISFGDPVNFVVGDFEVGTMDCEVTEVVPLGYEAEYLNVNDGIFDDVSCAWTEIQGGQFFCDITNTLLPVDIDVSKVWIDENPQFDNQNIADAEWSCPDAAFGPVDGFLQFFGNPGSDTFSVLPDWEDGTTCSIVEVLLNESGIEVDDSECQGLLVTPGSGASCTIYNTRLYEGIPTLSQYGLGLLALLMLGMGFVAFRRVI